MRPRTAEQVIEAGEAALTRREHLRLADVLMRAAGNRRPIAPLSDSYPELTAADAARIRDSAIVRRIASGARIIGAKVALGGDSVGGIDSEVPRLGWLTDEMLLPSPRVDLQTLIHPRVEAKVGFVLAERLRSPIEGVGDLLALTERVVPCLEVLDIRYRSVRVGLVDDIADNCAASGLLAGAGIRPPSIDELMAVRVRLSASSATAAYAPPRSPVRATLWLANQVIAENGELEPGALLISSACCPAVELVPSLRVCADFGPLGSLALAAVGTAATSPAFRAD
jgi:2-keto-4-pentenoate hydratase